MVETATRSIVLPLSLSLSSQLPPPESTRRILFYHQQGPDIGNFQQEKVINEPREREKERERVVELGSNGRSRTFDVTRTDGRR